MLMQGSIFVGIFLGGVFVCGGVRCVCVFVLSKLKLKSKAQIFGTRGLISADRRTKPTLVLTIPRSLSSRLQRIYRSQR